MTAPRLWFENVAPGDSPEPQSHTVTRTDLVMYAGASGDYNPMHHDDTQAQSMGLPGMFGHGMFSAGLLATALTDFVGIGRLVRYRVRFTKQTWPGDVLLTHITVRHTRSEEGQRLVDLDCGVVTATGTQVLQGEATAWLPSRDGIDLRHEKTGAP